MKRSISKPQSQYGKSATREAKRKANRHKKPSRIMHVVSAMPYVSIDGLLIYKPKTMNVGMYVSGVRLHNDQFKRANGLA